MGIGETLRVTSWTGWMWASSVIGLVLSNGSKELR